MIGLSYFRLLTPPDGKGYHRMLKEDLCVHIAFHVSGTHRLVYMLSEACDSILPIAAWLKTSDVSVGTKARLLRTRTTAV
eukprot:6491379-Amphidinium_carterae.1